MEGNSLLACYYFLLISKHYTLNAQSLDLRTGTSAEELRQSILDNLTFQLGRTPELASLNDWYMAVSYSVRDRLMKNWMKALGELRKNKSKIVGYLSAEFLVGPHLGNALINLDIEPQLREALTTLGVDFNHLVHCEEEPGLGNGGLGRLAACYLDSMATLQIPSIGYGLRYEFGIFDQRIVNGEQVEITDKWLRNGNPWELAHTQLCYKVGFGGYTQTYTKDDGTYDIRWIPSEEVKGVGYDTPIPGYRNGAFALLRLWKSEAPESFDFNEFNRGNYALAVEQKVRAENISKVLYPNDETEQGKRLRLMQQYFFVSCSLQDVLRIQQLRKMSFDELPKGFTLQLNDTHPSIAVAELMRLLLDEHDLEWDDAWRITQKTFAYTNHTLLPEALETWALDLFGSLLPRHLEIIREINRRFLDELRASHPGNDALLSRVSILDEYGKRCVRMAHLATVGSKIVNGVSKLHTELLKQDVLRDFYKINPKQVVNVTNGVTPRRWMQLYNPAMSNLITECIGDGWLTKTEGELVKLEAFAKDKRFQQRWREIKRQNKQSLTDQLMVKTGILVNPDSLFDIQVKRIHEYKRQHLNLLHIIALYNRIKANPKADFVPRTFVFGGKAAPGYAMAKLIIKLVNAVAQKVNNDFDVAGRLKVVFYPDYNVKNAEWVYRAADVSEQISTAGKEASGTGNMKFGLNGALTIGTLDGANVEMMEAVGKENFFLFGLSTQEVYDLKARGYQPRSFYESNSDLKGVLELISSGFFSPENPLAFEPIVSSLLNQDPYLVLADFESYSQCQEQVAKTYLDQDLWTMKSILNVARMGYFSSDRSIRDYCDLVWKIDPGGTNSKKVKATTKSKKPTAKETKPVKAAPTTKGKVKAKAKK
jgi:starch phosphorylase